MKTVSHTTPFKMGRREMRSSHHLTALSGRDYITMRVDQTGIGFAETLLVA